jgi:hypothetical protein
VLPLHRLRSAPLHLLLLAIAQGGCTLTGPLPADNGDSDDSDGDDTDGSDGSDGSGRPDASGRLLDGSFVDSGGVDTGPVGQPDALIVIDASPPDAGLPPPEGPFTLLSESGLYADIASHTVVASALEFEPEFKLWSDAAAKRRWIRFPPGAQINSDNMARWSFPRGTIAWKEFSDPDTGKRLETRIIQRLSSGDFYFASFIWNEDDTEAVVDTTPSNAPPLDIPAGCSVCDSPPCLSYPSSCHVVPQASRCNECHGGENHKYLGFSAVQLSHDGPGLTLTELADRDLLTTPPPAGVTFPVPGTPIERAAIGYLHANCGHCHASSAGQNGCYSLTSDPPDGPGMQARVLPDDATVEDTQIWQSAVDQPLRYWLGEGQGNYTEQDLGELIDHRILSGNAARSAVWYRMSVREWGQLPPTDDHQQMPYFATNEVDEAGLAAVELWINSLP